MKIIQNSITAFLLTITASANLFAAVNIGGRPTTTPSKATEIATTTGSIAQTGVNLATQIKDIVIATKQAEADITTKEKVIAKLSEVTTSLEDDMRTLAKKLKKIEDVETKTLIRSIQKSIKSITGLIGIITPDDN